jgi:hypothetical protein
MSNDNSVPPVNETAEMLHWQIEHTQATINVLTAKIAKAEEQLAGDRRALDSAEAHLRRLETLALIVDGRPPIPAPRDVCEYPDGSIRIGVLVFQHPGPNASEDDLRFFAASMRAIYDVTTPAATHAIQEANAKRHVTAQATVETSAFPAVPPQDATEVIPAMPGLQDIRTGQDVIVHLKDGSQQPGRITHIIPGGFNVAYGTHYFPVLVEDVESIEPAEVSDQVASTPAASVTVPDEAVRTDG